MMGQPLTIDDEYVSFRPFLYVFTWVSTLLLLFNGDFASVPEELRDNTDGIFWVWGGLSLWAPPVALLASVLIRKSPQCKYRALWLRLSADFCQFIAILVYLIMRIYVGDYHVYSMAFQFAALGYMAHLVMGDSVKLMGIEALAAKLRREG
jgi:hypothetical protein